MKNEKTRTGSGRTEAWSPGSVCHHLYHRLVDITFQDPVLVANVVSHHCLPIRETFAFTLFCRTIPWFCLRQISSKAIFEMCSSKMILKVTVWIFGGSFKSADGTDLFSRAEPKDRLAHGAYTRSGLGSLVRNHGGVSVAFWTGPGSLQTCLRRPVHRRAGSKKGGMRLIW